MICRAVPLVSSRTTQIQVNRKLKTSSMATFVDALVCMYTIIVILAGFSEFLIHMWIFTVHCGLLL